MNIVIINGSPRKNGATARILHTMEQQLLGKANVYVEFVNISDLEITPCSGCCLCYKVGHCYMNDDAEKLSNRIALADGLVIGSPTYVSNISGQLKQFIDRGHFVIEQLLHGKYAVSIATGENYGSSDTSKIITKLLKYSGARVIGKIVCNLPFNEEPNETSKVTRQICDLSEKIYGDFQTKRKYLFQTIIHKIIFTVGIKPFVERKGENYKGVIDKWRIYQVTKG